MTIKKSLFCNWQLIPNFFIAYLPILVQCKTKAAAGAVCAYLRNWQLGAVLLPENLRAYFELSAQAWILYKAP